MNTDLDMPDLVSVDGVTPVSHLQAIQAERMAAASRSLREVQAWASAYAVMLEKGGVSVEDLLSADAAFLAATKRACEALNTFGAAVSCEGSA